MEAILKTTLSEFRMSLSEAFHAGWRESTQRVADGLPNATVGMINEARDKFVNERISRIK